MPRPMINIRHRKGAVIVIAVLALIVLAVVASLTVDVGHLFYGHARLQNAADAAVLAAAQMIVERRLAGLDEGPARAWAAEEAHAILVANWDLARFDLAFGSYSDGHFVAHDASKPCTAVRVVAHRDESAPGGQMALFFAPLLGGDALSVSASAVSNMNTGLKSLKEGLRPFSVPLPLVQEAEVGETFVFDLAHKDWEALGEDYLAPGNLGFLDLSGGIPDASEMISWMLNGYPDEVVIDPEVGCVKISGTTGVRDSLKDAFMTLIGEPIFVCVHDGVTGAGTNAEFSIVRFAGVTIQEIHLTGNPKYVRMKLDRLAFVPIGQGETGGAMKDNLCRIQLAE